jgi:predicted RNase H-like nuclease
MIFLGVDLAWGECSEQKPANRSGVVALDQRGRIRDAGWTCGVKETAKWLNDWASGDATAFIDAPLMVNNNSGQRQCEREVGQRFGSRLVSANSTNRTSSRLAGVRLCEELESADWRYDSGLAGPGQAGRTFSECYPYTTLVGAKEFGFNPRPAYKRKPRAIKSMAEFWPVRIAEWSRIVNALDRLSDADPPLDLRSNEMTDRLRIAPSPREAAEYKKQEDLLDAVICAWTAAYWQAHGTDRCSVLGDGDQYAPAPGREATIIAPTATLD